MDLVGDAESLTVLVQRIGSVVELASKGGADLECDLESGRCFAPENLQHLRARERYRVIVPEKFRALPAAEFTLAFRCDLDEGRPNGAGQWIVGEQTIAFAD